MLIPKFSCTFQQNYTILDIASENHHFSKALKKKNNCVIFKLLFSTRKLESCRLLFHGIQEIMTFKHLSYFIIFCIL
jgi:hypothetical protein